MNIEREETGTLTATLKLKLLPEDYAPGVEKALKEQRKSAVLPGFRPGQVPMSIIKKKVGRAILVNEVDRLIDANLKDYIQTNAIKVLGQPLPKKEEIAANNWDEPGEFTFAYELGMAPAVEIELNDKIGVAYPVVDVNDELVQKEIDDMQRRFGSVEDTEVSEESDLLLGDMIELNADGTIKEGGLMNSATMSLEFIKDDTTRRSLVGKSKGDEVVLDPHKVSRDHEDLARMLGVEHEQVHAITSQFMFRIAEVKRMARVPVDQALFDRVYGKDAVTDEASFREKVREGLGNMFKRDSDRIYQRMVMKKLYEKSQVDLPDSFLKRWIQETSKEPLTLEKIEADYGNYADGLKRQLVQDTVIEKYGLEAKGEEMDAFAERYVTDQFLQYGMPEPDGEQLQQMAARVLGDREQVMRMRNSIVEQKLNTHLKALLSPKENKVSFDAFVTLAKNG